MVRLLHARTSEAVGHALTKAKEPFFVLVYSDTCGHCVRVMPAFKAMLALLGVGDVVQLESNALRANVQNRHARSVHAHKVHAHNVHAQNILSRVQGVPFIAVLKASKVVPLPDSSDRSVGSLVAFATKHMQTHITPRAPRRV